VNDDIPPNGSDNINYTLPRVSLAGRIFTLQQEHRDLDLAIAALYAQSHRDQLQLQRMKKKKLQLKDDITRLKRDLIPDLNA
jgi:hypothetical protein